MSRPRSGHEPVDAVFIGERDGSRLYVGQVDWTSTEHDKLLIDATVRRVEERGKVIDAKYFGDLGRLAVHDPEATDPCA